MFPRNRAASGWGICGLNCRSFQPVCVWWLGFLSSALLPFLGEGSPTKIALILLTSLLKWLVMTQNNGVMDPFF